MILLVAQVLVFSSLLVSGSAHAQAHPRVPISGVPLSAPLEVRFVVAAARSVLVWGEKTVIVPERICRSDIRDDACHDSQKLFGPPHLATTLAALETAFGGGKESNDPPTLQFQRPFVHNDTVLVLMWVTRPATDRPPAEKGWYDMEEYDVRLLVRGGVPHVVVCELLSTSSVRRMRAPTVQPPLRHRSYSSLVSPSRANSAPGRATAMNVAIVLSKLAKGNARVPAGAIVCAADGPLGN